MHIYKFRILLEDNDQFFREIDIKANQTFEDLHQILGYSAGFDNSEMASFYICDSKWNKQQEISICDMTAGGEEDEPDADEEDNKGKRKKPILTMCDTTLKDVIIDPHQKIIYIYDFLKMHTFYIELFKIKEAEKGVNYPHIAKSTGQIHHPPAHINPEDITDEEEMPGNDDPMHDDEDEMPGGDEALEGLYDDTIIN